MGILNSLLRAGERNDDPDPATGLTSRDRALIKNSWEIVMRDSTGNGMKLFMRLFEIEPKYQLLFPFRDVPIGELPQNKKFLAHCNTVIYSIGSLVGALHDPEILKHLAEKIAENHARRGLNEQAMQDVKWATLNMMSFLDADQSKAWNKLLDLLAKCFINSGKADI